MQLELQGRISRLHQGKDPGLWGGTVQSQGREGPSAWERRREEPCERERSGKGLARWLLRR